MLERFHNFIIHTVKIKKFRIGLFEYMQKLYMQEEVHVLLMVQRLILVQWQVKLLVHDVPIIKILSTFIIIL